MGLRGEQDGCSLCSGVPQGKMTIDRLLITKIKVPYEGYYSTLHQPETQSEH